jgi:hypothetical protein
VPNRKLGETMKEKKYTRTVAFRVTADEAELLDWISVFNGDKNVSTTIRNLVTQAMPTWKMHRNAAEKRAALADKRAAKKAAPNNG